MAYPVTINREASNSSKLSSDVDFYRRFYSIRETVDDETILVQFVAPKIIGFEDYKFYLWKESTKKKLEPKRYYRPDYVSFDEYGTTNLWNMLLFINDISTIEEFNKDEILVPSRLAISQISKEALSRGIVQEIVQINTLPLKATPSLFLSPEPIPNQYLANPTVVVPQPDLYFNRETVTLTTVPVLQKYIDLLYEPVENYIIVTVDGKDTYTYNKHYTITRGNDGNNRLTWDPMLIPGGVGMLDVMIEGALVEIQYAVAETNPLILNNKGIDVLDKSLKVGSGLTLLANNPSDPDSTENASMWVDFNGVVNMKTNGRVLKFK